MGRLRRGAGRIVAGVLGGAALLASASAAGVASDAIPRPPGAVDGRGYELVSQPDKNRNNVLDGLLSADGNRVFYNIYGGAPGTTTGARAKLLASRTAGGWVSKSPMPPRTEMPGDSYALVAAKPDFSQWIASAQDSVGDVGLSPDVSLMRVNEDGTQVLLHRFPVYFGSSGIDGVASTNLDHVFTAAPEQIDPSHRADTRNVYDFGSGTPVLVSRLPGTGVAPTCGVVAGVEFARRENSSVLNWASSDGSHVFFLSRGDDAPACSAPRQLYLRDLDSATTTQLSDPWTGNGADAGVDRFVQADADGTWAYFTTATSYVAADDADGNSTDEDVYRWDEGSGLTCATCVVSQAQLLSGDDRAAVSEDGSHVYFESAERLADAPSAGSGSDPNIYVLRGGAVHFVAPTDHGISRIPLPPHTGNMTPDGNVLIFASSSAALNTPSADNGGTLQYYRYDDRDDTVTCISCPPGGAPATSGVSDSMVANTAAVAPDIHTVTGDGETVFFASEEALVPEDVNGGRDVYEWHAGTRSLITDGVTPRLDAAKPELLGTSLDGRDVLFLDPTRLTADARDGAYKLYDARAGGGFPPPVAPPAPCDGEACRGALTNPPSLGGVGSETLHGGGNVTPAPLARFAVRRPTHAQRLALARTGRAVLRVRVTQAGRVSLRGQATVGGRIRTVARASKATRRAATVRLRVQLSKAARKQLHRTGRLTLVLVVRYTGDRTSPRRLVLSLKRPAHRGAGKGRRS